MLQTRPAIVTPTIDALLVGGLMIILLSTFIILSHLVPTNLLLSEFAVLTVVINGTHFLASYRLLYSTKENVARYRSAAIYIPLLLCVYGAVALFFAANFKGETWMVNSLVVGASIYLAAHYTGQAWGMMASFAFLDRMPFEQNERIFLRYSLRVLALWQVGWALTILQDKPLWITEIVTTLMPVLHFLLVASLLLGIFIFARMKRRNSGTYSLRTWIPFFSLFFWYGCLWIYPQSIFWIQIAHALQYLSFPARVEINSMDKGSELQFKRKEIFKYLVTLVAMSCFVFAVVPWAIESEGVGFAYWLVIASIINIHHFYIDGCVWHIRNPDVRKRLFAHVQDH